MSQQLYDAPAIISINSIDNVNSDQQLNCLVFINSFILLYFS